MNDDKWAHMCDVWLKLNNFSEEARQSKHSREKNIVYRISESIVHYNLIELGVLSHFHCLAIDDAMKRKKVDLVLF